VSGDENDRNGHGSASASNAVGRIGTAHEAHVIPVRVFPGSGENTTWKKVICGLKWVDDNYVARNIRIVSMSIAGPGTKALQNAVKRVVNDGLVVVAAAGNNGGKTQQPASYGGVIAATALGKKNSMASFSANGGDMTAPGVHIHSADKNGGYSYRSGTSRSAPQVAGGAAVVLGVNPALTAAQVLDNLQAGGTCPDDDVNGAPGFCSGRWKGDDKRAEPQLNVFCAAVYTDALADPADVTACGL
jgi:serine protease